MFARWSAFFVWALVAASAVAWGLKLFTRPLIGAQRVQLRIGEQSLAIGTDGLQPFAVLAPVASPP